MTQTRPVSLRLNNQEYRDFKKLADNNNMSISAYIRAVLRNELDHQRTKNKIDADVQLQFAVGIATLGLIAKQQDSETYKEIIKRSGPILKAISDKFTLNGFETKV